MRTNKNGNPFRLNSYDTYEQPDHPFHLQEDIVFCDINLFFCIFLRGQDLPVVIQKQLHRMAAVLYLLFMQTILIDILYVSMDLMGL